MTDVVCKQDGEDSVFGKNGLTGIWHRSGFTHAKRLGKSCNLGPSAQFVRLCGTAFVCLSSRLLHPRTSLVCATKHLRHKDTIGPKLPKFIDS